MQILDFSFFALQRDFSLRIIAILVVQELVDLQSQCLYFLGLQRYSDVGLITFLIFGLQGESVLAQLLTDSHVLLQHDLLILAKFAQLLLSLGRSFVEYLLQVSSGLLAVGKMLVDRCLILVNVLEEQKLFREGTKSFL